MQINIFSCSGFNSSHTYIEFYAKIFYIPINKFIVRNQFFVFCFFLLFSSVVFILLHFCSVHKHIHMRTPIVQIPLHWLVTSKKILCELKENALRKLWNEVKLNKKKNQFNVIPTTAPLVLLRLSELITNNFFFFFSLYLVQF